MDKIHVRFKFEGINYKIDRIGYQSVAHFEQIADEVLFDGLWTGALRRKHNLHNGQMIGNTFRTDGGQAWLAKRIIETGRNPHPKFWTIEAGLLLARSRPELKSDAKSPNIELIDLVSKPIAATEQIECPDPVDTEDNWIRELNDQIDQIDRELSKIEAYDRTVQFIKSTLQRIRKDTPMAKAYKIVLELLETK